MKRRRNGASAPSPEPRRCAIYTRKSTAMGLEQEFNSLDAQRECCEQYIAARAHEGWLLIPERYDDGGFTGANIERPAFKRLLADAGDGTEGKPEAEQRPAFRRLRALTARIRHRC